MGLIYSRCTFDALSLAMGSVNEAKQYVHTPCQHKVDVLKILRVEHGEV